MDEATRGSVRDVSAGIYGKRGTALRHVLEPIWEVKLADQSYGFRPGRSCKDALRRVQALLRSGHKNVSRPGGFDFLGYHFEQKGRRPRKQSLVKFKERVRELTRRLNGHSMPTITGRLNAVVKGWFEYVKHSSKRTFPPLDAWIRMRLRSILLRRRRKRGVGKGLCHYTWTNGYFAKLGLFTMTTARASARRFFHAIDP